MSVERTAAALEGDLGRIQELEKEVLDQKILNKGKDFFVEQLQKERNVFVDQLLTANRKMGEVETKLIQIESSAHSQIETAPNDSASKLRLAGDLMAD